MSRVNFMRGMKKKIMRDPYSQPIRIMHGGDCMGCLETPQQSRPSAPLFIYRAPSLESIFGAPVLFCMYFLTVVLAGANAKILGSALLDRVAKKFSSNS